MTEVCIFNKSYAARYNIFKEFTECINSKISRAKCVLVVNAVVVRVRNVNIRYDVLVIAACSSVVAL